MKPKHLFRGLLLGVSVAATILIIAFGLFLAIWGWARFKADFWPLDRSFVGPNLVASVVTIIIVLAHNEGRVIQKDEEHHANIKQIMRDAVVEAIHPTETAEENVAEEIK